MGTTDDFWVSRCHKDGMLNNVFKCDREENGMQALRAKFPDATANEMNVVLFSTSGIMGSYCTIEDCEQWVGEGMPYEDGEPTGVAAVTFLVIHPRQCVLMGGNCQPRTADDFVFLKKLRETSWHALSLIGQPAP